MTLFPTRLFAPAVLALSASVLAAPTLADVPARIRGTVVSLDGGTLKVRTRNSEDMIVRLADNWSANGVAKASMADIKPGVFIGTAAVPKEGSDESEALEVLIFPEAMRGTGEGHNPWDLRPNSTMTNATVDSRVEGVNGGTLTLSYKGGSRKVTIPPETPVVTFAPATKDDIKPGAAVFVPAQRKDDGTLAASRVLVGKDGVVPPM